MLLESILLRALGDGVAAGVAEAGVAEAGVTEAGVTEAGVTEAGAGAGAGAVGVPEQVIFVSATKETPVLWQIHNNFSGKFFEKGKQRQKNNIAWEKSTSTVFDPIRPQPMIFSTGI